MLTIDRFDKAEIKFHYDKDESKYSKSCIKNLLDAMHGINIELECVGDLMELIKFIQYEHKSGKWTN